MDRIPIDFLVLIHSFTIIVIILFFISFYFLCVSTPYPNEVISSTHTHTHSTFVFRSPFFSLTPIQIRRYLCIIIISFKLIFQHPNVTRKKKLEKKTMTTLNKAKKK